MPTYSTPTPIDLAIDLQVGRIEILAGDRDDTVVTVVASNPEKANDRRGAEETKVEFDGHRMTIRGPRPRISWIGPNESVDVKVEMPTSSRLTAEIGVGRLLTVGRLGATRIKSSLGSVDVDTTGDLWLRASLGNATVKRAEGGVEITASLGQIRLGRVTGDAVLNASCGAVEVEEADGDLDAKLACGNLTITRALGSVVAKIGAGSAHLSEVSSGSIQVDTGGGEVMIGVRPGVPAWLNLTSKRGQVRNELARDGAPAPSEQTVEVHAHTQLGDITIRRAA